MYGSLFWFQWIGLRKIKRCRVRILQIYQKLTMMDNKKHPTRQSFSLFLVAVQLEVSFISSILWSLYLISFMGKCTFHKLVRSLSTCDDYGKTEQMYRLIWTDTVKKCILFLPFMMQFAFFRLTVCVVKNVFNVHTVFWLRVAARRYPQQIKWR